MSQTATARKPGQARPRTASGFLLTIAFVTACTAAGPIATMAIDAGRRLLLDTAKNNFEGDYTENFSRMLDLMMLRTVAPVAPAVASDTPPAASEPAPPEPIELEVTVVREVIIDGRPVPIPVEDGSVLRDGIGRSDAGDNLKIRFESNVSCYVYAVWVDATAWATPIFPKAGEALEPVQAGHAYSVPEGSDWFFLDDYRGVEHLCFVASYEPLEGLAEVLAELAGQERSFRSDLERPAIVEEPGEFTRGLAGTRHSLAPVTASDGSEHEVASQAFMAQVGEGDLLVTRWFRHE